MIFEHLLFDITEYNENIQDQKDNNTIILLDDNVENEDNRIVAQAISLDIRGDFGFFLNRSVYETKQKLAYEWTGNLFHIVVKTNENIVEISDLTDEENSLYSVALDDWHEALLDWKQFYLHALGFLEFDSAALCHMLGVLILTYDQMFNRFCSSEMFSESIKKCSDRYGVSASVIYRDCKKVTGLNNIKEFYCWAHALLNYEYVSSICRTYVQLNIKEQYGDIRPAIKKYLNIIL